MGSSPGGAIIIRRKKSRSCHLPTHLISTGLTLGGSVAVERILRRSRDNKSSAVASMQAQASVANHILGGHNVLRSLKLCQHTRGILLDSCYPDINGIGVFLEFGS